MRRIYIVVHEDVVLSSVSAIIDLLKAVNDLADSLHDPKPFNVELIAVHFKNIQLSAPAQLICTKTFEDKIDADLIIIPPFNGNGEAILKKYTGITQWIHDYVGVDTEWASLCLGAYFLAEAGLLNDKKATSHWKAINDLAVRYPDVQFLPDQIITDYNGVYTSGGAFSSLNLILYLIEKFCGKEYAIAISKDFAIDMDRHTQTHFASFKGHRRHDDVGIHTAQDFIETNYLEPITIDSIAAHCNMSRRNFIRRFVNVTGLKPLEYIQHLKVEAAKKALENSDKQISSVMYDVGYNDIKTFRDVFKRLSGLTPQAYQKKYNRLL